jgi:filamentous hemagglutinin family protein
MNSKMPQPDPLPRTCGHPRRRQFAHCLFRLSAALGVCVTLAATVTANGRDILRPGSGSVPTAQGIATGASSGAVATQARTNALDAMARTTRALQSVQAMQNAARAAAITGPNNLGANPNNTALRLPNVSNGLGPDGLEIATGATVGSQLWQGANLPTQSASGGQTTVSIKQFSQQAILNWNKFNIGKQTTLNFDQSAGGANSSQWIAFNKITDPSGVPSQILGSIKAEGQVYVINQNGIIFGGSSQVNTHALVASSLPINDNLINRGLLNNPDSQFLFTSLPQPAGSNGTAAFTPPAAPNGKSGDVTVQPGAVLSSPTTADHTGGRVALIGPNVTNAGTISTPDGQTILAAGQQVGFAPHPSSDAAVRGLDVYVGTVDAGSGTATNSGLIDAPRANVTMTGKQVNQLGAISSSTSASLNGSISLFADYNAVSNLATNQNNSRNTGGIRQLDPFLFLPQSSGTVTLGAGSAMQILPETASSEKVVGSKLALSSQVQIQGQAIHLAADSTILAPSANIALSAGAWNLINPGGQQSVNYVYSTGQIYLDGGALINAAGTGDVAVSVAQNIIEVQLRGSELKDSPLQRNGALRGQTVTVDIRQQGVNDGVTWVGSPIGDLSGYVNLIERTVAELTTAGGTVTMNAGGSVVLQGGSKIDVSGGWINYQGAMVQTTRVLSGGHIYDISQATPNLVYDGIYTGQFTESHPKWSLTNTYSNPINLLGARYEAGYIYGASGGTITISAPGMALDGSLLGTTVAGPRQRSVIPKSSSLSLLFRAQDASTQDFRYFSPTPANITFDGEAKLKAADPFALDSSDAPLPLRADRTSDVVLSPGLTSASGFGNLTIENNDGNITIPAGVSVATSAGGTVTMKAGHLAIYGSLTVPAGTIALNVYNLTLSQLNALQTNSAPQTPAANPGRGTFILGSGASISAAGLLTDDRRGITAGDPAPLLRDGGSITINSFSSALSPGAMVDVSGGVSMSATGKATYGKGGSLTIKAGQDLSIKSVLGGTLSLGATLRGYSGGDTGGSLSITAPLLQIGGTSANPRTLVLSPDFFSAGGFTNFTLTGLGERIGSSDQFVPGVLVATGTQVSPVASRWVAVPYTQGVKGVALKIVLPQEGVRTPVKLTLASSGVTDQFDSTLLLARGDTVVQESAVIRTDAGGSITLSGNTTAVLGSLFAPGGSIAISAKFPGAILNVIPSGEVWTNVELGSRSVLSTAGATVLKPDARGYRTGSVLNGGTITVAGNIVAEAGAVLDVSGTTGILDVAPTAASLTEPLRGSFKGSRVVVTAVSSDGGTIRLTGDQALFTDATLLGFAGGASARGGSLFIQSGRYVDPSSAGATTPLDTNVLVTQSGPVIPAAFYPASGTAIGRAVLDTNGVPIFGQGYFAADSFNGHGFDDLTLAGTVKFSGPVNLTANHSITAGTGGVLSGDAAVNLTAPYVSLGSAFQTPAAPGQIISAFTSGGAPFYFAPTHGTGSLTVQGSLIDLGNLSLQGFGGANFVAANGDIRGNGTLDVAGSIAMTAGQIYPPTAVTFTIAAYDYATGTGSVTIRSSGSRQLPLSAGGQLNIYATNISQGGVLRAPFGGINIGWDGTGTAPTDLIAGGTATMHATQQVTLQPGSITSVSAVDPSTGKSIIVPYGLNLNGTSWIDPAGTDITLSGLAGKAVTIAGENVTTRAGSVVDIQGGGDLYAYRWLSGNGGSTDILSTNTSFAVIPGYGANYALYAPYNTSPATTNLGTDAGYVNSTLAVGDSVYLSAGSGLPAGTYTLLPARYALLPGAFLITPQIGVAFGTNQLPTGASIVSGYRFNAMRSSGTAQPTLTRFEIATGAIVRKRAEYEESYANNFFTQSAAANNATLARLPGDAGSLVFSATQGMALQGSVKAMAAAGGRGGLVDINSSLDILIGGSGVTAGVGVMALDATVLSGFGAESLLIGGVRKTGAGSTSVKVNTNNITLDNADSPLAGSDVILLANRSITVADGAQISATGTIASGAPALVLGDSATAGSGNGTLLRVSADPAAGISRLEVNSATQPVQTIGHAAQISGAGIILDSTYATDLSTTAILSGTSVTLDSGQISIQLTNPGALQTSNGGLVLAGPALQSLQSARTLSLLSYSSIDVYGTGTVGSASSENLQLHAGEIRRMDSGLGGSVSFAAKNLLLDNSANGTSPGAGIVTPSGTLSFDAANIQLGAGTLAIDGYTTVELNASARVLSAATGTLTAQAALKVTAPFLTGAAVTSRTITAGGALDLLSPTGAAVSPLAGGLGANYSLQGTSVKANTAILLPSGTLTIQASTGNLTIGGTLDVGGTAQTFFDVIKFTDAGQITLTAAGNVAVQAGSAIRVSADPVGGNAGTLSVIAGGSFTLADDTLFGQGGTRGHGGSFSLDVSAIPLSGTPAVPSLRPINDALNTGQFSYARSFRVRSGDVVMDGLATAQTFSLSADQGSITVASGGNINASGETGGTISLIASGSVTLQSGASLNVAAQRFNAAGKGGAISLEAGASVNGSFSSLVLGVGPQLDIQTGSSMDLGVAAATTSAADAAFGHFTGTLHLRAPQIAGNTDVQIQPIAGTITGASLITVEGYQLFNLKQGGVITNTGSINAAGGDITAGTNVQGSVSANGAIFGGNSVAIANRLLPGHDNTFVVEPGAEIINQTGNLTLGTTTQAATQASALANDWNLATFRFGPNNDIPGVLTLRAAGDLVFLNALSDGFTTSGYNSALLTQSTTLPVNNQSWSYRLTSGADLAAADFTRVLPLSTLGASGGSLLLGKDYGQNTFTTGTNATTSTIIPARFQVIRTGSGDITISAGRDVRLLNQFATIYTAGTKVDDATMGGTFDLPVLNTPSAATQLGAVQEPTPYTPQYSLAGGNVTIVAQNDITHQTLISGVLTDDSSKELPNNWLYRRGYVAATGTFGTARGGDAASTTWWTDFSNFFEGVGTLGGGNLTMNAGHDVSNVDGLVATNARMPKGTPDAAGLLELGGGDLSVRAGHDINAGVYYVERGAGSLSAGNEIRTNSTRSPSRGAIDASQIGAPETWLPTTLFLGKGSFDVTAQGSILLGPVANAFLLPEGYSNTVWYKTYFSTYGESDAVNVTSLGGSVNVRSKVVTPSDTQPLLQAWLQTISLLNLGAPSGSLSFSQPWLRLNETNVKPFTTLVSLMPPTFRATAFSGDINIAGDLTLSPSSSAGLELTAAGSVNGLQPAGAYTLLSPSGKTWVGSTINLSDADPSRVPGIASPFAFRSTITGNPNAVTVNATTTLLFLTSIDQLFQETGSFTGQAAVLQNKQALHAAGVLHSGDTEPVRIYGGKGSISGITLFSGKAARIVAGQDVTDFAFYIQNVDAQDVTLVSAGRDVIAYYPNSPLLTAGSTGGNLLGNGASPRAGDIQLSGPGTLEVFAGRNLTTGVGPNNADGTGVGILTIGNARNPALPEQGAQVIAGAGIGYGQPDFTAFIRQFLDPASGGTQAARYLTELAMLLGMEGAGAAETWTAFGKLSATERDRRALDIFYLALRDAGRDHNDSASANYGTYTAGFAAIAALFPTAAAGDINLTSREIKTKNGGSIQLLAPGGKLTVGIDVAGNQALDQGILTEGGGGISIFTKGNVDVGTSRIFTLRGGDEIIWSSTGDIAAGASSKTVQSAPPTKVLVDPQSGDVRTDISGLATGGGIGVLASVAGIAPGSVDLMAPLGAIDAGDAGIRSTGKLNVAATVVLNASNIQASGGSTGTPTVAVSTPNLGSLAAGNTQAAATSSAGDAARQASQQSAAPQKEEPPSIFTIEVLGYGGGED